MNVRKFNPLYVAALLAVAFLGGVVFSAGASFFAPESAKATNTSAQYMTPEDLGNAFSTVAESVNPAVVQIIPTQKVDNPFGGGNNPFRFFFGTPNGQEDEGESNGKDQYQQGLGSGFLIREDGYIVTNNHVVKGATELKVRTYEGKEYTAKVIGTAPQNDIAVIKVEGKNFPTLNFTDSNALKVGQWVVAIGSPFEEDLGNTVTAGIVSGLGRANNSDPSSLTNFIQTDAAINPGNSGGPLLNLQGKVVGVNSAILTRSGGFQGIGFAIPSNVVQNAVSQLIEKGSVSYGYLGLVPAPVPGGLARAMNLPTGGALVSRVEDGKPAAQAGLEKDDVITALDGKKVNSPDQLRAYVANKLPGTKVNVNYYRDGRERSTTVTLGERPKDLDQDAEDAKETNPEDSKEDQTALEGLGATLQSLTQDLRNRLNIKDDVAGVLITDISPIGVLNKDAGLNSNFVLQFMGETRNSMTAIKSKTDFMTVYKKFKSGDTVYLRGFYPTAKGERANVLTAFTKP